MALTFKEIKETVFPYAGRTGKCPDDVEVATFARMVMQNVLFSGSQAGERRLTIYAVRGSIALPPEVEVPLKVKINNRPTSLWNKWFTFHSTNEALEGCCVASEVMKEDGDFTPIAFPLPPNGSQIGVMGICDEEEGAAVIVQGKDNTGRPVVTIHKGEQVYGEKLSIKKGQISYGQVQFGQIDAVLKPKTNGYVSLYAVSPGNQQRLLLADYTPYDEKPLYKKMTITQSCPEVARVAMICRVRLKDNYHDNDITFFDNPLALMLAAQRIQAEKNTDIATAAYKTKAVTDDLEKEASYKKISGSPCDIYFPLSGGAVKNMI